MLCRAADMSYDPALTAASIATIWKFWSARPGNILVPGHDLPMVLEPDGTTRYVGEREAAIRSWFGDSVEQTTLIQLTVS
jgi:N-acyl homoserine lactone hydrolase